MNKGSSEVELYIDAGELAKDLSIKLGIDVIDAALTHLIESEENIDNAQSEYPPNVIQNIANTSVIALWYRTSVESTR